MGKDKICFEKNQPFMPVKDYKKSEVTGTSLGLS